MTDDNFFKVSGLELYPFHFQSRHEEPFPITEIQHEHFIDCVRGVVCHEFRIAMVGTKPEIVEAKWPATWKDAFFERWFPTFGRWFPKAFKVNWKHLRVVKAGLYPSIPLRGGEVTTIEYIERRDWSSTSRPGDVK